MSKIAISVSSEAAEADLQAIDQGFEQHRDGLFHVEPKIYLFARDEAGSFLGGAQCAIYGDAFMIKRLLVKEDMRGTGLGSQLIERCAEVANDRGCTRICLDTMSYQAPEFYKKLGFKEKGVIRDFYAGHDRVFFERPLRGVA